MAETGLANPYKYRVEKSISLRAVGRLERGAGVLQVFSAGKPVATVALPSAEWTLLAVLLKAALRSAVKSWPYAFVDGQKLADELERLAEVGGGEITSLHRVVHRLRKLLSRKLSQVLGKDRWGAELIELQPSLGYRLSIWPGQLHLTLLDESEAEKDAD